MREPFERVVATARRVVLGPLSWSMHERAAAVALALGVILAFVEKRRIQSWVPPATLREPGVWLANALGGGVAVAALGVGLFVLGRIARRRAWVETALALAAGGLPCFVLTKLGQFVLAEDRPNEGGAMHFFVAFGHGVSGHASASALLFFPVTRALVGPSAEAVRRAATIVLVLWIAWVAWTRMSLGMHYAWNVSLGLAVGLYTGRAATHRVAPLPSAFRCIGLLRDP